MQETMAHVLRMVFIRRNKNRGREPRGGTVSRDGQIDQTYSRPSSMTRHQENDAEVSTLRPTLQAITIDRQREHWFDMLWNKTW